MEIMKNYSPKITSLANVVVIGFFLVIALGFSYKLIPFNKDIDFVASSGDYAYMYDFKHTFLNSISLYDSPLTNVYYRSNETAVTYYVPYLFFYSLLYLIKVPESVYTFCSVFVIIFFGLLAAFYGISKYNRLLQKNSDSYIDTKTDLKILRALLSIIYVLNPLFIDLYPAGHFTVLLLFYSTPLVLSTVIKYLFKPKYKQLLKIYLWCFLFSSPFGNIGILLVFIIGLVLLTLPTLKKFSLSPIRYLTRMFTVFLVCLVSNLWWIVSFIYGTYLNTSEMVNISKNSLGDYIVASKYATFVRNISYLSDNKFFGTSIGNGLELLFITIFVLLFVTALITLCYRKLGGEGSIIILLVLILVYFFSKGGHQPYAIINHWLYENVWLMQIIRRPLSKLFWLSNFIIVVTIYWTYITGTKKIKFFTIGALLVASSLVISHGWGYIEFKQVNLPNSYELTKVHLEKENYQNTLVLPFIYNKPIHYDETLERLTGLDFLPQYLNNWNYVNLDAFKNTEHMLGDSLSDLDLCEIANKGAISHLLVRNNLTTKINSQDKIFLDNHTNLHKVVHYEDSFTIYKIECRKPIDSRHNKYCAKVTPYLYKESESNADFVCPPYPSNKRGENWLVLSLAGKRHYIYVNQVVFFTSCVTQFVLTCGFFFSYAYYEKKRTNT